MEDGLAKLDFLSDANSRMKKFNQLTKKVMEKLYDFIIPGNFFKVNFEIAIKRCGLSLISRKTTNKIIVKIKTTSIKSLYDKIIVFRSVPTNIIVSLFA